MSAKCRFIERRCVCGVKIERKICKRLQNDDDDDANDDNDDKLPVFGSVKCCVEGLLCGRQGVGSYWK